LTRVFHLKNAGCLLEIIELVRIRTGNGRFGQPVFSGDDLMTSQFISAAPSETHSVMPYDRG